MRFTFKLALKHLISSISQSILIILAVALGVMVIIFIPSVNYGFYNELLDKTINTAPHISIVRYANEEGVDTLTVKKSQWYLNKNKTVLKKRRIQSYKGVVKEIEGLKGITAITPYIVDNGNLIKGEQNLSVVFNGILFPEYQNVVDIEKDMVVGSFERLNPDGIAISQRMANKLRVELNDSIILSTINTKKTLKVVVLFNSGFVSKDTSTVYISLNTAQNLAGIGNQVDGIGIKVVDPWKVDDISRQLTFATGLQADSWKVDNESLLSEIASFNYISFLINVTIMLAVGAGVLGIMIILINSKHKQIGMLKALGVTSRGIVRIFVFEGLMLSFLGSVVGSLFSTALLAYYNANPMVVSENYGVTNIQAVYDPMVYFQAMLLSVCAGCIAAFIPAYYASKIEPAEVLKS